ncbi:hypothetical protein ACSBOX_03685 [Arthrobacter sp. KN11-1C]
MLTPNVTLTWRAEEQISVLCMACIGINAFNRLSILSEHRVRKARS